MSDAPERGAERQARIAELESRLASRPSTGVRLPVAVLAILVAAGLLWSHSKDIDYWFSPRAPLQLGSAGDYRFESLRFNRYAQVHGVPTSRGAYALDGGKTVVVVGLRDTPILVRRRTLPGEAWQPGAPRAPQPNQAPFTVRGRLLSRADAQRYEAAFVSLEKMGEVTPRWLLLEAERPGADWATFGWMTGLGLFALINAGLVLRELRRRL